ncbi:hypothetical protein ACHAQA_002483 [Verticillium albo-atrum]
MPARILEPSSGHAVNSTTATRKKYIEVPTRYVPTDGLLDALARKYGKDSFQVEMRHNVFHITIFTNPNPDDLQQDSAYNADCA